MREKTQWKKFSAFALSLLLFVALSGCSGAPDDKRGYSDYARAAASVSAVDALGRVTKAGDVLQDRDVGLFYFLWLGAHTSGNKGIYDVTKLLEESPDELWSTTSKISPAGKYHFWGEPLYGYYHSTDPWVLTRHVELFTAVGIDYLLFDVTNGPTYDVVVRALLAVLDKYYKQGFAVPKIAFLTNSAPHDTVVRLYNSYYAEDSENYYPHLWYSPGGKPLICSNTMYFDETIDLDKTLLGFFDMRKTQWPDALYQDEDGFPWISWTYPQTNHNGTMSVSIAQHVAAKMSLTDSNWGRGYSQQEGKNLSDRAAEGINFEFQWKTVFDSWESKKTTPVTNVMVTGWNEWIAIKGVDNGVYFVDNFNAEYSRDIEMVKGAYGDNFYLQLLRNVRKYKYTPAKKYRMPVKTIQVDGDRLQWADVAGYPDFNGDALQRDSMGYLSTLQYVDQTARNDITMVKVTHDKDNLYFYVETAADITAYNAGDTDWMNIWLSLSANKQGYDFVVNREKGRLHAVSGTAYADAGAVQLAVSGNSMTVAIPLKALGIKGAPAVNFKVSDNVRSADVMNFYIQGDSAPVGRLNYTYGYFA